MMTNHTTSSSQVTFETKPTMDKPHIHLFAGCGGVGKTTLSAAWAYLFAQKGYQVALITIDPAKRLAQSLGLDTLDSCLTQTNIHHNLWAMMLDQEATSHRLVSIYAKTPEQIDTITQNRYFNVFSSALAGVQEMMAVHEVHEAVHSQRFHIIILDTPPAQHTLDLLSVSQRLQTALDNPALSWLLREDTETAKSKKGSRSFGNKLTDLGKQVALKAFTKMTSTVFLEDLLEFLKIFHGVLTQIKNRGLSLEQTLKHNQSHIWIVTSPETVTLKSAKSVSKYLQDKGFLVRGWFVNRTPLLFTQLQEDLSLDDLLTQAKKDLKNTELDELNTSKILSILHEETERARDALQIISPYQENASLTFIEELPQNLSPIDLVKRLSTQLEDRFPVQLNSD